MQAISYRTKDKLSLLHQRLVSNGGVNLFAASPKRETLRGRNVKCVFTEGIVQHQWVTAITKFSRFTMFVPNANLRKDNYLTQP